MKQLCLATGLLASLAFAGTAHAQAANTSTVTANGAITILQPLTITKTTDLIFGRVVRPSTGSGTVTIANTGNTVTTAGGAVALSGIATSRATFSITGEGGQIVNVTVPATFNLTSGANTLAVTLASSLGATVTLPGALGAAGTSALNIGGSLTLPSTQASGAYTGTFSVTVTYQ